MLRAITPKRALPYAIVNDGNIDLLALNENLHDLGFGFADVDKNKDNLLTVTLNNQDYHVHVGDVIIIQGGVFKSIISKDAFEREYETVDYEFGLDEVQAMLDWWHAQTDKAKPIKKRTSKKDDTASEKEVAAVDGVSVVAKNETTDAGKTATTESFSKEQVAIDDARDDVAQ